MYRLTCPPVKRKVVGLFPLLANLALSGSDISEGEIVLDRKRLKKHRGRRSTDEQMDGQDLCPKENLKTLRELESKTLTLPALPPSHLLPAHPSPCPPSTRLPAPFGPIYAPFFRFFSGCPPPYLRRAKTGQIRADPGEEEKKLGTVGAWSHCFGSPHSEIQNQTNTAWFFQYNVYVYFRRGNCVLF